MPKILLMDRTQGGAYEVELPSGKSKRASFRGKSLSGGKDVSFTAAEIRFAAEGAVAEMEKGRPEDSAYYKSFVSTFPDTAHSAKGLLMYIKGIPDKLTVDEAEYATLKGAGAVADEPAPPPPRKPREGSDKPANVPAAAPPPPPKQSEGAAPQKPREGSDRPSVALRKSPRESTVTATAISKSKAGKERVKQLMPDSEKTVEGEKTAAAPSAVPAKQPPGADPAPGPAGGARAFDNTEAWWDDAMESIMQHVESGDGEASPYYQVLMSHGHVQEKEAGIKRYDMLLKAVLAQRSRQQLQQTQTENHVADVHKGRDTLASGAHADATGDQHDRDMHESNTAIHAAEAERQRQQHAALRSRAGAGASASGDVLQLGQQRPHEPGAQPRMQATGRSGKAPANAATAASNALSNASQQFQFRPSTGVGPTKRPRTHLQGPGQQPQQPEAPGSIVPGSGESAAHTAMTGLTATGMPAAPFHAGAGLQPTGMPAAGGSGSGSGAGGGAAGGQPPQQPPVGFPFQQQAQAQQVAGQQQQQAAAPAMPVPQNDVTSKDRPAGGEDSGYKGQTTSVDVEKGLKGTIHRVAVRRICTPKGINFAQWTASWLRTNGASLKAESDAELLQGSIDLCQQYIDTMRVKAPRFGVGAPRMKLLKERVELEVLAAISTPSEEDGLVDGSRLGLLLDASKLGMDLSDLEAALKGGGGGGAGTAGGGAPNPHTAPLGPDGKPKKGHAVGSAHQIAESGKNAALAGAVRTFDRPDEYKHMRNPNDRIQREFVADRRLYNNDLTMQHPITPDTFTLKIKRNETQRRVLF